MSRISRRAVAALLAVSTLLPGAAFAADAPKEIRIDWATYNPVSIILKQQGLLEKGDGLVLVTFGAGYTFGGAYLKWAY